MTLCIPLSQNAPKAKADNSKITTETSLCLRYPKKLNDWCVLTMESFGLLDVKEKHLF
jgi:hypothetical protein